MTSNNSNNLDDQKEEPKVVLTWNTTTKATVYTASELRQLRKGLGGQGFAYYNPVTEKYEQPRSMNALINPPSLEDKKKRKSKESGG